ncbi:MAG: ATP-binding cassette domain-containing protein [Propionibacteriaceae bacterium]
MWYARQDLVAWPKINEARRHAAYREDQLVYPSRSVELACMDARGWLTERIAALHRVSRDNEIWLEKQGVRSDALSGLACAVLLVCALLALLVDGVSGAGVTAGAIGITSGIMATANVGFVVSRLLSGANAVDRYRAFVEREPFAHDDADHECHGVSVLRADGLTVRYPNAAAPSLFDASICARRGEIVAIVGSNGAGKTTLINALLGLVSVESGRIWFDDTDVTEGGFTQRHQGVALMPQDFGRYEFTVRENLALAAPEKVENDFRVWEALQRCKIDGVIDSLPDGLDAQLGDQWGGTSLSGGQWQRLALARMVLRDSPVWILDEPTSAIDAEAEEQIFRELRESAQDHIVIVVSHRAWTLRYTDRIYVLDHGRVVEVGSYDDLRCRNGRFAQLFRLQNVTDTQEGDVR